MSARASVKVIQSALFRGIAMKRSLVLVPALALLALVHAPRAAAQGEPAVRVVAPQKVGLAPDRLGRIGAALNAEIEKGKIPGAVVLVARRGQIGYFEAFGFLDKAAGKKLTRDAIFRVFSMTKPWVSVVAVSLMEDG